MKPPGKNPRGVSGRWHDWLAAIMAIAASVCVARAASIQKGIAIQNFQSLLEVHKAPNQLQKKTFLEGGRAEPLPGDRFRLNDVRLRTFKVSGEAEMVISAPESIFDRGQKAVSSAGPLRVETADGKFSIEGVGYLWTQTNSSLVISNQVRTFVDPVLLNSTTNQDAESVRGTGPIHINAARFEYSEQMAAALYSGGVEVVGTNLLMTSEELTITAPMKERQVKAIKADRNVKIKYGDIDAEGQLANYWVDSGILRVVGAPHWRRQQQEGSADAIVIDRLNRVFDAEGNAFLRLSGNRALPGGLLPGTFQTAPTNSAPSAGVVEVRSQSYHLRTNSASFRQNVRVVQQGAGGSSLSMNADNMDLTYTGTNELQSLTADGSVLLTQQEFQLRSDKMDYEAATALAKFTGKPQWELGVRQGRGDLIEINTAGRLMRVAGNAWMQLPAGEFADAASFPGPADAAPAPTAGTNQFAEVNCKEYVVAEEKVDFSGEVRVRHPQIQWASEHITVHLGGTAGTQTVVAEPKVSFEVVDPKGQTVYGKGDRAVYTRLVTASVTNALVELFGNPATLQMTNGTTVRNQKLILDVARGTFVVPTGNYEVLGATNGVDTNMFRTPDRELLLERKPRPKR